MFHLTDTPTGDTPLPFGSRNRRKERVSTSRNEHIPPAHRTSDRTSQYHDDPGPYGRVPSLDHAPCRPAGLYTGPGTLPADRRHVAPAQDLVRSAEPVTEVRLQPRIVHELVPTVHHDRHTTQVRYAVLPLLDGHTQVSQTFSERQLPAIHTHHVHLAMSEQDAQRYWDLTRRLAQGFCKEWPTELEYVYAEPQVEEVFSRHVHVCVIQSGMAWIPFLSHDMARVIHVIHPVVQRVVDRVHHECSSVVKRESILESPIAA